MSLIPAEDLSFTDLVGEAFFALRGSGLMLSPVDVQLLRGYEAAAIPAEVLVRGLLRAVERRRGQGKPPPHSLGAIKRTLDAEARRFQAGQLRGHAPPVSPEALDHLLAHAREALLPEERAAYRSAYRASCAGLSERERDEVVGVSWLSALPRPLQRAVTGGVRLGLGARLAPEPRERYRQRLRAALVDDALERAELAL